MGSFFIRTETPFDITDIFAMHNDAFAQDGEARLVNALRNDGDFTADLSLVAVHDDRIIGHVLFPPITIESLDKNQDSIPALALAPAWCGPGVPVPGCRGGTYGRRSQYLPTARAPRRDRCRSSGLLSPVWFLYCTDLWHYCPFPLPG